MYETEEEVMRELVGIYSEAMRLKEKLEKTDVAGLYELTEVHLLAVRLDILRTSLTAQREAAKAQFLKFVTEQMDRFFEEHKEDIERILELALSEVEKSFEEAKEEK